ncbi:hypothetical protein C8A05DRAFT_32394 [Staphylotrichum tortipilum]|uniref:F-box domain-containing protein n=1 Tax=Staphylotrichum tortipilum TaxID=2831512 RepID=A0AAN6MQ05_9PEZI|nr:hypothetical protein C8A05DRAFT_32394 [Staphylotrichum longicolle]
MTKRRSQNPSGRQALGARLPVGTPRHPLSPEPTAVKLPPPNFFSTAPVELIIRIFQSCASFPDLRSLLLTSRRTHATWLAHRTTILAHVAPRTIPAFDRALLAVRATALVHTATHHGLLPPPIHPSSLTHPTLPSPADLSAVLSLHHLARCIETRHRHHRPRHAHPLAGRQDASPAGRDA